MTGEAATSSAREIQIPAMDGFALAATVYEPDALTHKVVLITGGTGVLRRFYDPFACFLQQQGFGVVTFDYRGIGDSRPPSLKGFSAQMAYSFEDDPYAPSPSVEALLREYPGAAVRHQHIVPGAITEARIGHFGFFRKRFRETLWQETVAWLKQH